MDTFITGIFGENPTVWNWIAGIVDLLLIGVFVNYAVTWLYDRQGWNKKKNQK